MNNIILRVQQAFFDHTKFRFCGKLYVISSVRKQFRKFYYRIGILGNNCPYFINI